jgi:hypothetical protein
VISTSIETGWYVYGVLPADAQATLFGSASGVDAAPIQLVSVDGLAAIVSRVPLREFGEEPLRRNLEVREWLEEKARAHDDALAPAVGRTALVPLRFGTVYRSEDGVREMLEQRSEELHAALERLRGRVEVGVKAFLTEREQAQAEPPALMTGREYLLRKQRARTLEADAGAACREAVGTVHEHLASLADDARANPPQHPELTGRREQMALNAAYLVAEERQEAFVEAVARLTRALANEGIELVLTGPWPPYNFVQEDGER